MSCIDIIHDHKSFCAFTLWDIGDITFVLEQQINLIVFSLQANQALVNDEEVSLYIIW